MSADNWGICPRCKRKREEHIIELKEKASKQYGKISQEEYLALLEESENQPDLTDTLREYYELYTNEHGELYIYYSCYCEKCGFQHEFKHEDVLEI